MITIFHAGYGAKMSGHRAGGRPKQRPEMQQVAVVAS